jgi:hypothetical protein
MSGEILECLLVYHQEDLQKFVVYQAFRLPVQQMLFVLITMDSQDPLDLRATLEILEQLEQRALQGQLVSQALREQ